MGKDGGILQIKVHDTARPYPDPHILPLFLLIFIFQVLYNPHHFSMVPRALFQAPYVYSIVDPLKGSYTKAKSSADVRQSVQRIFKIIFSFLGPVYSFPLFSACKIALMLMASSVKIRFDVPIRL